MHHEVMMYAIVQVRKGRQTQRAFPTTHHLCSRIDRKKALALTKPSKKSSRVWDGTKYRRTCWSCLHSSRCTCRRLQRRRCDHTPCDRRPHTAVLVAHTHAHTRSHAHTSRPSTLDSRPFQIKYVEGGERAVSNFEAGASGFETRAFRGLGIFTSTPVQTPRPQTRARVRARVRLHRSRSSFFLLPPCSQYEVSDDQDSVQMLQRSSQVGEFYRMSPPPVWKKATLKLPPNYMVTR